MRLLGKNIGSNGLISARSGVVSFSVMSSPQRSCFCTSVTYGV